MPKAKKTAAATQNTGLRYADKSEGQPQLVEVFDALLDRLKSYAKGSIVLKGGTGGQVSLVSEKQVVIEGRPRAELYFAGALIQKGYVGFYYFPVYCHPPLANLLKPELHKCLKGKSCFHIKRLDPLLLAQIEEALAIGYRFYAERGWID